jgi:uncharacterized membrane protein HdeD (DUF308 family)
MPGILLVAASCIVAIPAAASPGLPTQFAGEALTVALAFALPALLAGAYLGLQSLRRRVGARTLILLGVIAAIVGALTFFAPDWSNDALQWAGLAR